MNWIWSIALALGMTSVVGAADPGDPGSTGGEPSLFDGTMAQSVAAIIVFLGLFAVLKLKAWGPILQGLQDREKKIRQDLQQAEQAAKEAESTLNEYRTKLTAAQDEVKRIIDQGKADAAKIAAGIKDQTQRDVDQLRQRAQDDIRLAKEHAVGEIYAQAGDLATRVAERILRHEIKSEDHEALIEEALAQLTAGTGS